jgi:hypothetical protein
VGANRDIFVTLKNNTDATFILRESGLVSGDWQENFEPSRNLSTIAPGETKEIRLQSKTWSLLTGAAGWIILRQRDPIPFKEQTEIGCYFNNPYIRSIWTKLFTTLPSANGLKFNKSDEKFEIPGAGPGFFYRTPAFAVTDDDTGGRLDQEVYELLPDIPAAFALFSQVAGPGSPFALSLDIVDYEKATVKQPLVQESTFASLWRTDEGKEWYTVYGMNSQDYQKAFDEYTQRGLTQVFSSGFERSGEHRFCGIWERRPVMAWAARHGLTSSGHQQAFNELTSAGYRQVSVSVYAVKGQDYYNSIYHMAGGPAWVALHGRTSQEYQQKFDELTAQGYYPVRVCGCSVNGKELFAAIFHNGETPDWISRHGLTEADFNSEHLARTTSKYNLADFSRYAHQGNFNYTATWVKQMPFALTQTDIQRELQEVQVHQATPAVDQSLGRGVVQPLGRLESHSSVLDLSQVVGQSEQRPPLPSAQMMLRHVGRTLYIPPQKPDEFKQAINKAGADGWIMYQISE